MHKNCLLHNTRLRYENKSFLISKHTEIEKFILGCVWITCKSKQHPILKMMGLDNSCAILCSRPSRHIGNNKHYNNMQWGHVSDITLHISLFPFHLIHIVWPSSTPPSHEKATHQRQIQQILCEIEQLCATQQCPGCNSQYRLYSLCMCVNVIVTYEIQKTQQREMIFIWLEL